MPSEIVAPAPAAPAPASAPTSEAPASLPGPSTPSPEVELFAREAAPAPEEQPSPTTPAAPPPVPDDPLARTRDDLSRRDRELLQAQGELRARQHQLAEFEELRKLAATDPLTALRRLGGDPMQAADRLLGGAPPEPPPEIKGLHARIDQLTATIQAQANQTARQQEHGKIRDGIHRQADSLPVLRALAAEGDRVVEDILSRAATQYRDTGRVPDYGPILAQSEAEYTQQIIASLRPLAGVSSIKEAMKKLFADGAPSSQPAPTPGQPVAPAPSATKVLTAALSAEPRHEMRRETPEEAEAAALAMMRIALHPPTTE